MESHWLPVGFRFPSVNSILYHPRAKLDLVQLLTLSHAPDCYSPITPDDLIWAHSVYLFTWTAVAFWALGKSLWASFGLNEECWRELRWGVVSHYTTQLKRPCHSIEKRRFNKLVVYESAVSQLQQGEMFCPGCSQYVSVVKKTGRDRNRILISLSPIQSRTWFVGGPLKVILLDCSTASRIQEILNQNCFQLYSCYLSLGM